MPTEPAALVSRLGALALAVLSLSCQGSDNPLAATPPPTGNAPPNIVTAKVEPAAIDRQGTALVQVVATDPGSVKDFQSFCKQTGNELLSHTDGGPEFTFLMKKR